MKNQNAGVPGIHQILAARRVADADAHEEDGPRGNRAAQSGTSPPPRVQFFGGATDTVGRTETFASWRAFREYLVNAGPFPSKDACPMFSAGIFDGPIKGRIPTEFTLVVGEHDDCEVGVDEAVSRLEKAGIAAFIHTSASHTPERPRWRVVAPLQRPCSTEDYLRYLNLLNGAVGGCLAHESGDLSRRGFYGRVAGAPYEWKVTTGRALIDNVAAGEHTIGPVEVKPPKKVSSAPANTAPRTEHDISRAISALKAIPNSREQPLPYERWRDLAMALHEGTGGDQRALDALIAWTDDGKDEKTTAIWNRFTIRDGGITVGTLINAAREAGWQDPGHAPDVFGFTNLNDEREELFNAAVAAGTISAEAIVTSRESFNRCDPRTQPVLAYRLVPEDYRERFEKVLIAANVEYSTLVERLRADAREYDAWGERQRAIANGRATVDSSPPQESAKRFEVVPAMRFAQRPGVSWQIKHVLPRTGLAVIYGQPASGKSFFALDLVASIARGTEWRGKKTAKGRVVYVAAEGAGGFASRVRAYLQAHNLSDLDVGVVADVPNFHASDDGRLIAARVKTWGGADVIVVDTLAASSAGADENTGKDMNQIVGRMAELQRDTGALVVLIHHSGKDESKGARGWSGLKAAVDVEIEVSRPDEEQPARVARVTKQKDGESGQAFGFELRSVPLGTDEDGESITSCVVEAVDEVPAKRSKRRDVPIVERRPRGQYQQAAYDHAVAAGGPVHLDDLLAVIVARMQPPEEGKRDKRRANARTEIEKLISWDLLEVAPGGCLRVRGMGGEGVL